MIQRPINRAEPALPAAAFKTYQISAPLSTHFRSATCAEVECPDYLRGWRVRWDNLTPELRHAATTSGRRYRLEVVSATESWLLYEAGQPCFRAGEHRVRVGRPELFIVRGGDHRGDPLRTPARRHTRPELWVEEFAEHQQGLADKQQKG